ncbi:hypothetical protein QQF64_033911 [Cirrhinus molitorella]|uniref:DNA helicase n=1 Tax=Cirrhinus molitorella TaxID=172907 RepID=A0ABR3MV77_9TELE
MKRLNKPVPGKKDNLLDTLEVAVGVHVMVTRNLDVEDRIVNGCFGKIANIVTKPKYGIATVQMLELPTIDNPNAGQKHSKKVGGEKDILVYIERSEENRRKGVVR